MDETCFLGQSHGLPRLSEVSSLTILPAWLYKRDAWHWHLFKVIRLSTEVPHHDNQNICSTWRADGRVKAEKYLDWWGQARYGRKQTPRNAARKYDSVSSLHFRDAYLWAWVFIWFHPLWLKMTGLKRMCGLALQATHCGSVRNTWCCPDCLRFYNLCQPIYGDSCLIFKIGM